jgi:hypothetical protein
MNKNIFFILHLLLFLNSYLLKAQTSKVNDKVLVYKNTFQEMASGQNISCSFDFRTLNNSIGSMDGFVIEYPENTEDVKFTLKLVNRTENHSVWEFEQKSIDMDFYNFILNKIIKGVEKIELTKEEQNNLLSFFKFQFTLNHSNRNITLNDSISIKQILEAYKITCQKITKNNIDYELDTYEYNEEEANSIWEENTADEISEIDLPTYNLSEYMNNAGPQIDYGDKTSTVNILGFDYYGGEVDQIMGFLNEFKIDLYSIAFDTLAYQEDLFLDMFFPYIQTVFDAFNMTLEDKKEYSSFNLATQKQIDYWNTGYYSYYTNSQDDTILKEGTWFINKQNDELIQRNQNDFFTSIFSTYFKRKGIEGSIDFGEAFSYLESIRVLDYGRIKLQKIKKESNKEIIFTKTLEDKIGFRMEYYLRIEY